MSKKVALSQKIAIFLLVVKPSNWKITLVRP